MEMLDGHPGRFGAVYELKAAEVFIVNHVARQHGVKVDDLLPIRAPIETYWNPGRLLGL